MDAISSMFTLGGKISDRSALSGLLCLFCCQPLIEPRQVSCGDRFCADCRSDLSKSSTKTFKCKRCGSEISAVESFRDRAVDSDLKRALFPCQYPACPWTGSNLNYRDHAKLCKYAPVTCIHPGCDFRGPKSELIPHLETCPTRPVKCQWCKDTIPRNEEEDHIAVSCSGAMVLCTTGCGEKVVRKELSHHLQEKCLKQKHLCKYNKFGCQIVGDWSELTSHEQDSTQHHLKLVSDYISGKESSQGQLKQEAPFGLVKLHNRIELIDKQFLAVHGELARISQEMNCQLSPLKEEVAKLQSSVTDFQDSFSELALMVQTLQATSYNGEFIWKIPEVARRTKEAQMGKTISLYSAPFFTSRFGYKMCLRLYLNGDGSGKGTFISFFLTIMRGEYDTLLSWPFQQMVTLMLLDQDKQNNVVQAFRPEPSSSSFWKPKTEMNVASGCPKFAPLSVLNNPSYVRNDTIYFKIIIDQNGLTVP